MRLELPVRWTEADREAEKLNELTKGENNETAPKYSYGRLSIDSEEIGAYYDIDSTHIMLNDKNGKIYCVTVPFDEFKKIFTEVTGKAIMAVKTTEEYRNTRPKKGKKDDDNIDDILNS